MGTRIASTPAAEPFDDSWAEKIVCRERLDGTVRHRLRVLMIRGPDGEDLLPPIRITDEHLFWVVELEDFLLPGELETGDHFLAPDGQLTTLAATESEAHAEGVTGCNFEVKGAHTYFVLPDSLTPNSTTLHGAPVLVHNAAGGDCLAPRIKEPPGAKRGKGIGPTIDRASG